MHSTVRVVVLASLFSFPLAVQAQTVSEADAKKIEEKIKTYGYDAWSKPGAISVRASDNHYQMILNIGAAIKDRVAPWQITEATPIVLGLVSQPDGLWAFDGSGEFNLKSEYLAANRSNSLTIKIGALETRGVVDPEIAQPRAADFLLKDIALAMRQAQDSIRFDIKNYSLKASITGKDVGKLEGKDRIEDLSATFGTFPNPEVKIRAVTLENSYEVGRLDFPTLKAMNELMRVKGKFKSPDDMSSSERDAVREVLKGKELPMDNFGGDLTAQNISLSSGGKTMRLAKLSYGLRFVDLAKPVGKVVVNAQLEKPMVDPGFWPAGLDKALPETLSANVTFKGMSFAGVWEDVVMFRTKKEIALLPPDHYKNISELGVPKVAEITDVHAQSPFYDISVEGNVDFETRDGRGPSPAFELKIVARDFDKTVQFLQEQSKTVPVLSQASFVALMAKGLGRTSAEGVMTWDVKGDRSGKITINGQPLPV